MTSCIVLSAGKSSRFGSPKALASMNKGVSVIEHILKELLNTRIDEIIVVLGADSELIKPVILKHKRVKVVYNKCYNFGQTSSFKVGLENISEHSQGIMLLPVDFPYISRITLDDLISKFIKDPSHILIPAYKGKKGHPPIFASRYKENFLALDNDEGINSVALKNQDSVEIYEVNDGGILKTFNTKNEFRKLEDGS